MYFQITTQVEIESRKERCLLQAPLSVVLFFFSFPLESLIMKVHSSIGDNLSGKMIEGLCLLCWSWFKSSFERPLYN